MDVPRFSSLPLNPAHPQHSAWAVWGEQDELGTLNHLTPEVVVAAKDEIQSFRKPLEHKISTIEGRLMHMSSQWDGFRHCGYEDGKFYGVTASEIQENRTDRIGIHGGLVSARDYRARSSCRLCDLRIQQGLAFDPLGRTVISLDTVKIILELNGTPIRADDMLVIRTGFLKAYTTATPEDLASIMSADPLQYPGVENSNGVQSGSGVLKSLRSAATVQDSKLCKTAPQGFSVHQSSCEDSGCR
ncbi:hypothetical protein BDW59DRAFT_161049 [Aspergillus cavernicola]|uniref:Uncharacterized protein n=1 Tax=Aspergillus cavernicola TaxID=176166 RepID=A0ABR4IEP8_9EURO